MRFWLLGPLAEILCVLFTSQAGLAEQATPAQVSKVVMFYEVLATDAPSVEQFFALFGRDNESELALILGKKFPSLDSNGNWSSDVAARTYVEDVNRNPAGYPSIFLACLKSSYPGPFSPGKQRKIGFPPITNEDLRRYEVWCGEERIVFEFSQVESFIENIYLSNGQSIDQAILKCR